MARYTITLQTKEKPAPFAGFDNLHGECVEATYPESLGVYMPQWQIDIFRDLEPGQQHEGMLMTYFREW